MVVCGSDEGRETGKAGTGEVDDVDLEGTGIEGAAW